MNGTEAVTKLIEGFRGALRQPIRLLAMLSLVAVIAASCGSDATTAASDAVTDEQVPVTAEIPEVESSTTTEPEPEAESEPNPAPDTAVVAFTEAAGVADADEAWSFVSDRCGGFMSETPDDYSAMIARYALDVPGATAVNVSADVFADVAAISYDVHNDSGEFFESYTDQPWAFIDGNWYYDHCQIAG